MSAEHLLAVFTLCGLLFLASSAYGLVVRDPAKSLTRREEVMAALRRSVLWTILPGGLIIPQLQLGTDLVLRAPGIASGGTWVVIALCALIFLGWGVAATFTTVLLGKLKGAGEGKEIEPFDHVADLAKARYGTYASLAFQAVLLVCLTPHILRAFA